MNSSDRARGPGITALVIVADPNIEALLGQLIVFAGHQPIFDVTAGAAGDSIRRVRPAVAFIDTALRDEVAAACLGACAETGARPILVSSTMSERELEAEAASRGCHHFPLPGPPSALAALIHSVLGDARPTIEALPNLRVRKHERPHPALPNGSTVHPAIRAAMVSIAHAGRLTRRGRLLPWESHAYRSEVHSTLEKAHHQRAALRAAITDYAAQLRDAGLPSNRMLEMLHQTMHECAASVGAVDALEHLLDESRHWAMNAYSAA